MKRAIRLCLLTLILGLFAINGVYSAKISLSGVIARDSVRILLKDNVYYLNQELKVEGTLIIEPGTRIEFYDNGRIVAAANSRLIADGFANLTKKNAGPSTTDAAVAKWPDEGFADMRCFLYPIADGGGAKRAGFSPTEMLRRERTIHPTKYNYTFNVALDTAARKLVNIVDPIDGTWPVVDAADQQGRYNSQRNLANTANDNIIIIPFETAIMFMAARMNQNPALDVQLKLNDWSRGPGATTTSVDVTPGRITFIGQPQNNQSREWGHIIVLPGARTAFFRNCLFEDIKKDTTVDNRAYYTNVDIKNNLNPVELGLLNSRMLELSNGGGGAITTFSSRTWILDCEFNKNFARNRGGAVQILQAPTSYFYANRTISAADTLNIPRFDFTESGNKNFKVSDRDSYESVVMNRYGLNSPYNNYPRYPKIDMLDELSEEYFRTDIDRQAWDDARLAGYLGRFRNLVFNENMVRLANTTAQKDPQTGWTIIADDTEGKVPYPLKWGNMAWGGALYIAGTEDDARQIEFTLGMNDSIKLGGTLMGVAPLFQNPNNLSGGTGYKDYVIFNGNTAQNLQDNKNTDGARGGAIYVGKNTSLIIAGEFTNNYTDTKWLVDTTTTGDYTDNKPTGYINGILFSNGGAIYSNPVMGRLQIRGDRDKDQFNRRSTNFGVQTIQNTTKFVNNRSGAGGAIFVASSSDVLTSPQIGGSDEDKVLNYYGWRIQFNNNYAYSAGGAVYSERNTDITGAGGARDDYQYSLAHLVRFDSNAAAFAGGAVHIEIPTGNDIDFIPNTRIFDIRRAEFRDNNVGKKAWDNTEDLNNTIIDQVRGGGAIYTLWTDLNVVRGAHFTGNDVYNGNGGAIAVVNPYSLTERLFVSDLDIVKYAPLPTDAKEGTPQIAVSYESVDNPFTFGANYNETNPNYRLEYPNEYDEVTGELVLEAGLVKNPVIRMLNIFEENSAFVDSTRGAYQIENYGNTQISKGYIMPNANMTAQWWFNTDNGFIGSRLSPSNHNSNLFQIIKDYSNNTVWEPRYDDSLWHAQSFTDIVFTNSTIGFVSTDGGVIVKTTDKGATWRIVLDLRSNGEAITDMVFATGSGDLGLAVTNKGRIYRTTDAGQTWSMSSYNALGRTLNGVFLVSNSVAYAVGSEGTIVKSTDGGINWTIQYAPNVMTNLNKLFFTSVDKGWALGDNGLLLYTTDGGNVWDIVTGVFASTENLASVAFYGQNFGYIATSRGNVYQTTDGGTTWTALSENFGGNAINSIFVLDFDRAFVVGNSDMVFRTTDGGNTWTNMEPYNKAEQLGNPRLHGGITNLVENGIGLGGAFYILDFQNDDVDARDDSIHFNRTRILDNFAFTGSAIYSDNYNLSLIFNRSLIRGNVTDSNNTIGMNQNAINGPLNRDPQYIERNYASSDLVSATLYGEVVGPFPTSQFSVLANSIFENEARFLIRLPDAPNTKGILAGQSSGVGKGGTDTLMGNYWGHTEANVGLNIMNLHHNHMSNPLAQDKFMTFFVEKRVKGQVLKADRNYLPLFNMPTPQTDLRRQGPFEYNTSDYQGRGLAYDNTYSYIELNNADNTVPDFENIPAEGTIPEKYLFSYDIYDLHDKGTDIKTADYSKRRMFPIEDFAVGNPFLLYVDNAEYTDVNDNRPDQTRREKYVKRWVRNPEFANALRPDGTPENPILASMQRTWTPLLESEAAGVPKYYHPLGMPIYLETKARINVGDYTATNRDYKHQASTVFFVINETTQDFIRVELKQIPRKYDVTDSIWADDIFRATVFLVPDSTERQEPQLRRHNEFLLNLGSNGTYPFGSDPDYGTGGSGSPEMLRKLSPRYVEGSQLNGIFNAAYNEDYAALTGRKYSAVSEGSRTYFNLGDASRTQKISYLYSNRPTMPTDNDVNQAGTNESRNTYYAGERYGTLPANVGDVIRVVSRNVLWRQGVIKAYDGGLVFVVREGAEAPIFTGDLDIWGTPELNPYVTDSTGQYPVYANDRFNDAGTHTDTTVQNIGLLNKVFVATNHTYPAADGAYSNARNDVNYKRSTDFILDVTAYDRNGFYDPRYDYLPDMYTSLIYTWNINTPNSGLRHWLMVDTVRQTISVDNRDIDGYLRFKGVPLNPYIVPGGEKIQVTATNYAPGIALIDSLNAADMQDQIPFFYQTFPPYLNAPYYNQDVDGSDTLVARYLQQDTIGVHGNTAISKELTIFVMDSMPRFIDYQPDSSSLPAGTFQIKKEGVIGNEYEARDYAWTRFQAGTTSKEVNRKYMVNLTDKLRFKMDLNTDDELEDATAEEKDWDFRYGRTAYSFANQFISVRDTGIVDTVYGGLNAVSQIKPTWMYNADYFKSYTDIAVVDEFMAEFQRKGQMNIRIDSADAKALLRRDLVAGREAYNTDTVMAIVANDGHGGLTTKFIDLYINFQPQFTTVALLNAVEGQEYNPKMDSIRGVQIFDANSDQLHRYELIYEGDPRVEIALDPSFPDETTITLTADQKATPAWLQINPVSGTLYGTPTTIRELTDTLARVTVLVTDEDGLVNIQTFDMKVETGNCPPDILVAPIMDCLVRGQAVEEELTITDRDLIRTGTGNLEELSFQIVYPTDGLTIDPMTIAGGLTSDTVRVRLINTGTGFDYVDGDLVDNRLPVKIVITDRSGLKDSIEFNIRVSDVVDFTSTISITNSDNSTKSLIWGTGYDATTGDDRDGMGVGMLDARYCEIEIPPLPQADVFDVRWSIPTISGTYRNIFPTARVSQEEEVEYRYIAVFQSGGENSGSSKSYPVRLRWDPTTIPSITDAQRNPQGSSWYLIDGTTNGSYFRINMQDTTVNSMSSAVKFEVDAAGFATIVINDNRISSFHIVHDWYSNIVGVEEDNAIAANISVNPSPVTSSNTNISFEVTKAGNVFIEMYDVLGNSIGKVVDGYYPPGKHNVELNLNNVTGNGLASGMYEIRMTSGTTTKRANFTVIR